MQLQLTPIGIFSTAKKMRYQTALQPGNDRTTSGVITLSANHNFEQALIGLEGFERIWLLFWFHENNSWRPKVLPPRYTKKVGVFATRSPHRPNPIGLSCVRLEKITGRTLFIRDHDLLDGTPILDIKPYIAYADAHPESTQGWLAQVGDKLTVETDPECRKRFQWILEKTGLDLLQEIVPLLKKKATPSPSNRIRSLGDNRYLLAFKCWRILFFLDEEKRKVILETVTSGYTSGEKPELHETFTQLFP